MNILFIGCDYFSKRKGSELNFYHDMIPHLSKAFNKIIIVSINNCDNQIEEAGNVVIYNIKPIYFGNTRKWTDRNYSGKNFHRGLAAPIYKTITFIRHLIFIRSLINKYNIQVVHFMRILGFFPKLLKINTPCACITMTVPTHVDRGYPLHLIYHAIKGNILKAVDVVIPTTMATSDRLVNLGINKSMIKMIRWSSDKANITIKKDIVASLRRDLNLTNYSWIVLWSGPLQGTTEEDFLFSIEIAKKVISAQKNVLFVFTFKIDYRKSEYMAFENNNLKVIETSQEEFVSLLSISHLFLSPITNRNRTVAPPLTWIEAMMFSVPIVTTPVDGVDEIVRDNVNGIVGSDISNISKKIINTLKNNEKMKLFSEKAKERVTNEYNIKNIAKEYIQLWKKGVVNNENVSSKNKVSGE